MILKVFKAIPFLIFDEIPKIKFIKNLILRENLKQLILIFSLNIL